ncbi:MAG: fibronectin type III domain-containing protein [Geobacteraceae bacterium]|nr:fibronectin type III domain-containing protein [Geobacteraceae bacterium]
MKKIFFLMMVFSLVACGKRGPLVPPESLVPAAIKDLKVEQKGNRFLVCWSPPAKMESGGKLSGIAGFRVFRREVLPPDQDCEDCPTAYLLLRTVDPEYLQDVSRAGSRYCFYDSELKSGDTYQYKVLTVDVDGVSSRDSNKVRKLKITSQSAPHLTALSIPTGVVLQWNPVHAPSGSTLEGYAVYRKQEGDVMPLFPTASLPAAVNSFEDKQMEHGVKYVYGIRSVVRTGSETVESELSNLVEGMFLLTE